MPTPGQLDPSAQLRSTQIVIAALALGVLIFAGVAVYVAPVGAPIEVRGKDVLAIVAVCVTLQALPLSFLVRAKLVKAALEHEPAPRIAAFRASRIAAAAMCEAAGLLWCVALLFSGSALYLGGAVVVVAVMFLHVPTRESFEEATGERVPNT
ncbi:MAG: hypothetical protein NTY35_12125 [Planctomycetota bacterium]|nr:hypothetical protein [Planctomycetota bacterium]